MSVPSAPRTPLAVVIGGGPAGVALAAELAARGQPVELVAPHPPRPFPATYGAWWDELPTWARDCTREVWADVRVYLHGPPLSLTRPYALLDNARVLERLLERAGAHLTWRVGEVTSLAQHGAGWQVRLAGGVTLTADLVVDATGHAGRFSAPAHPGGTAWQTAYGLVARFERPPIAPGAMVWMDYRPPARMEQAASGPTFLYAMHLYGDVYFVEETSLIARPAPTRDALEQQLLGRLRALDTSPVQVLAREWVAFPMNNAAPRAGPLLAFGAASGLVHPISGFQVVTALKAAPVVAQAVVTALRSGGGGPEAVQAAWAALWPHQRRAARALHLLGVQALLSLDARTLPEFFQAFFQLPPRHWQAFLSAETSAPALARTMLLLFLTVPLPVKRTLLRAAFHHPGESLLALKGLL